jgi:hypothetical protein
MPFFSFPVVFLQPLVSEKTVKEKIKNKKP